MPPRRPRTVGQPAGQSVTSDEGISNNSPRNQSSELQDWEITEEYGSLKRALEFKTKERTGFFPKPAQTRMAMALALGKDVTCIAPTGFGKSMAFQMAVFAIQLRHPRKKKLNICITPIEALGEDQVEKCTQLGINSVNLTDRWIQSNPQILRDIANGDYELGKLAYGVISIQWN